MSSEGFVSFMLEKDDSYLFQPPETTIVNDQEFYQQLSRQFYGQSIKKSKGLTKSIDPTFIRSKVMPKSLHADRQLKQNTTVSQQLQKQIYSLLHQPTTHKQQNTRSPNVKVNLSVSQKKLLKEPKTFRLRLDEAKNVLAPQNSHRSTHNSSTRSTNKTYQITDLQTINRTHQIYYPIKTEKSEDVNTLFKISFRNTKK